MWTKTLQFPYTLCLLTFYVFTYRKSCMFSDGSHFRISYYTIILSFAQDKKHIINNKNNNNINNNDINNNKKAQCINPFLLVIFSKEPLKLSLNSTKKEREVIIIHLRLLHDLHYIQSSFSEF